jgi:opacity protein-like surface antigen
MKRFALTSSFGLLIAFSMSAQEVPPFTFNIGAGFTNPVGNTGSHLDTGWNIGAGAGYNFNSVFAVKAEFQYNDFGINRATLLNIGVPDGSVRLWSLTLNPVVHLNPHRGPVDVYVTGGGGLYHRTQEFTAPTIATVTGFDPWFGFFFPVSVQANQVLASNTVNKPGFNVGMGLSFGTKWKAKAYAEARYHRMFIGDFHMDYLPVTFGIRF